MARVLVIDDDEPMRAFLRFVLEGAGHDVREARDGGHGVREYRRQAADLVVCDLLMGRHDGLQAIRDLRRAFPTVKVLAISGGDSLGLARSMGAATLAKPFDPAGLLAAVDRLLRG